MPNYRPCLDFGQRYTSAGKADVIPGRERSERTRNPEVVDRDSGFALARAPE